MEINEKQHLQKTLDVITKKIEESQAKIKDASARLRLGVKDLAENFHDMQSDLSNIYSSLADIESFEGELVKENKRLNLQKNTPYFARIDFLPKNRKKTQHIYIGIGNIIQDNVAYAVDWRAPISSMYYDYNLGKASYQTDKLNEGEITLKRQYKIEDGKLLSYFNTDLTINDEILQEILSHNVSAKMKQIVSTIYK